MKPRMAARGLFLNSAREAKRPDALEAIEKAKTDRLHRDVDRLAATERKKALQDAKSRAQEAPAEKSPVHGPSADVLAVPNDSECMTCHYKFLPGQKPVRKGSGLILCSMCASPRSAEQLAYISREAMMATRMVKGVDPPIETGTYTEESGYVRDLTEADRTSLAMKLEHARNNAPRTAWKRGQQTEEL